MLFFIYELFVKECGGHPACYCEYVKVARATTSHTQYADLRNTQRVQNYTNAISLSHLSYDDPIMTIPLDNLLLTKKCLDENT